MGSLIQTTGSKPTDIHTVVPTKNNSVFITGANGRISGEDTLPLPVQKNIEVENIKFKDTTTNNSSETKHGLLPKLSGESDEYLNGEGSFVRPTKVGSGFGNIYNIRANQTVTIGVDYENVVSNIIIDGALIIDGRLTIGI